MPGLGSITSIIRGRVAFAAALACVFVFTATAGPTFALTELKKPVETQTEDETTPQADPLENPDTGDENSGQLLPMPDSLITKPATDDQADAPAGKDEIIHDLSKLPEAVQKMRVALVEAAASGDIERLRPLLGAGDDATQVAVGDAPDDPIAALKSLSGDPDGREVLAILLDVISTGVAHVDIGTENETYVWPYFTERQLDTLSPPEVVELYRIVTAGDVADMKEFGGYNFYRLGISKDGKWKFFVAGD